MPALNLRGFADRPLNEQLRALEEVVRENDAMMRLLEALEPGHWTGAGAILGTVWNAIHGNEPTAHLKDFDIVYFDAEDLSAVSQEQVRVDIEQLDLGFPIDVVNAARVHLWYEEEFGKAIEPFSNVAESVATWPTFAASVVMRLDNERLDVIAPYGLHDLFAMWIRPNKTLISRDVYEAKASRWSSCWPMARVWDWS